MTEIVTMYSEEQLRRRLSLLCKDGLRKFCRENELDPGHVCNMMKGRKPLSDKVLELLGFEKAYYFRRRNE